MRYLGITGNLLTLGNLLFWCLLIYRARNNVLPTELVLFVAGVAVFLARLFGTSLPDEWRTFVAEAISVSEISLGVAFTVHTIFALRNRVDMTHAAMTGAERKRIEAKIAAYRKQLATATNEAQREHILFEIRALELLLDEDA